MMKTTEQEGRARERERCKDCNFLCFLDVINCQLIKIKREERNCERVGGREDTETVFQFLFCEAGSSKCLRFFAASFLLNVLSVDL